jgi:hypothetical protein
VSSCFLVPFFVLLFCYSKMCVALYTNFKNKKDQDQPRVADNGPEAAAAMEAATQLAAQIENGSMDKRVRRRKD